MSSETRGQWTRYLTEDGKSYYHNAATDVTTWDAPPPFREEEAPKAAPVTWVRYETEAGEHYYFNVQTNVTQWDAPPTFVTAAQYELVKAGNASTTGSQAYLPDDTPQQPAAAPVAQETPATVVLPDDPLAQIEAAYVAEVLGAMPNMGQYEVQAVEFRKMLLELRVPEGYTWTETLEDHSSKLVADPRFNSLPPNRHAMLFGEFQVARKAATIRRMEREAKLVRDAFIAGCEAAGDLGVGVSAERAIELHGKSAWWTAMKDSETAIDAYEEWEWQKQQDLWKAQEQQAIDATEAMRGLVPKLVSDKVTPDTVPMTYSDFCKAMETNKQWALVPRIKRIEMFEHAVRQMEDSISKMEAEERKHRHWNSLIVREALQKLMTDLWEKRSITYATMWTTFRDTHLYIAPERPGELLSRFLDPMYTGTSPRDLFEAFIEDKRPAFVEWASKIPAEIGFDKLLPYEEFERRVKSLAVWRSLAPNAHLLPVLYEERQNAMATRERQHASFRALLLDTYPREPRERSWAVVRKKLTGRTAFKAVGDEGVAEQLWQAWLVDMDDPAKAAAAVAAAAAATAAYAEDADGAGSGNESGRRRESDRDRRDDRDRDKDRKKQKRSRSRSRGRK